MSGSKKPKPDPTPPPENDFLAHAKFHLARGCAAEIGTANHVHNLATANVYALIALVEVMRDMRND